MSDSLKATDKITERLTKLDEQIALAKSEALHTSLLISQLKLTAKKNKLKDLLALKSALEDIRQEITKEEERST